MISKLIHAYKLRDYLTDRHIYIALDRDHIIWKKILRYHIYRLSKLRVHFLLVKKNECTPKLITVFSKYHTNYKAKAQ